MKLGSRWVGRDWPYEGLSQTDDIVESHDARDKDVPYLLSQIFIEVTF